MSLRREIRKILEAKSGVDSEYLEGASPALLPDGSTAGHDPTDPHSEGTYPL